MTKETMTVHKALAELKLLDKKIQNSIDDAAFVKSAKVDGISKIDGLDVEKFKEATFATLQSCKDLIRRHEAIKKAVTLSNAKTQVTVNGVTYTVAEAIAMHTHGIKYKQRLLSEIVSQYEYCLSECQKVNNGLEEKMMKQAEQLFANDTSENKAEQIKQLVAERVKKNTCEIVSGFDCAKEIEKLRDEIDNFITNIDAALSVSNATTTIEIEY